MPHSSCELLYQTVAKTEKPPCYSQLLVATVQRIALYSIKASVVAHESLRILLTVLSYTV